MNRGEGQMSEPPAIIAMIGNEPHARPIPILARREPHMNKQKSEVAKLLQQISLEYEAATRGLTGLSAGSAKHSLSPRDWNRSEPITSNS